MLLLECGRHSMFLSSLKLFLKFICKLSNGDTNKLSYICLLDGIDYDIGFAKDLLQLCNKAGMNTIFLKDCSTNPSRKCLSVKMCEQLLFKLHEQEKQNLFLLASNAQFHKCYHLIKNDFLVEKYMNCGLPFSHVKLIIAVRTEMFYLNYKPWINADLITEKCVYCNERESLLHVLFQCSGYDSVRINFFNSKTINNKDKQINILKGYSSWIIVGEFLYEINRIRKCKLSESQFIS